MARFKASSVGSFPPILVTRFCVIAILLASTNGQQQDEVGGGLPPMLDSDDVEYFFEKGDMDELYGVLATVFQQSSRNPFDEMIIHPIPEKLISRGGGQTYTTGKFSLSSRERIVLHFGLGCLIQNIL